MLLRSQNKTPFDLARDPAKYDQKRIMEATQTSIQKNPEPLPELIKMLEDEDSGVRYWAALGCLMLGEKADPAIQKLRAKLNDPSPNVNIAAAEILCKIDSPKEPLRELKNMLYHPEEQVRLHAINTIDYLEEKALPILDTIKDKMNDDSNYVGRVTKKILADFRSLDI